MFRDFAKQRGGTIFLSSHIMQEVESLCTSAIMIHNGKLLFSGATDDIIGRVLGSNYLVLEAEPLDDNLMSQISRIDGVEGVLRKSLSERTVGAEDRTRERSEARRCRDCNESWGKTLLHESIRKIFSKELTSKL